MSDNAPVVIGVRSHIPRECPSLTSCCIGSRLSEAPMRRSTTETLEDPGPTFLESCLGLVMSLAAFFVAAGVCSGILTLALMP